jgi:hypothetical protein
MGDPGVAKSQLLSYIDRLAARSKSNTMKLDKYKVLIHFWQVKQLANLGMHSTDAITHTNVTFSSLTFSGWIDNVCIQTSDLMHVIHSQDT